MALTEADYKLIQRRLGDYESQNATKARDEMVSKWKEHHPDAAKESSAALHPLDRLSTCSQPHLNNSLKHVKEPDEEWGNDVYHVTVRYWQNDPVFHTHHGMIQIGIAMLDGTARHDWREFQAIKNQIAGLECEAFELYPAESRLLDPSNYYTLWCFPGIRRLRIGHDGERRVLDQNEAFAPQRALP
jgi:hypothetical protein